MNTRFPLSRLINFTNERRIQVRLGSFRSALLWATIAATVLTCWVLSSSSSWAQEENPSPSLSLLGDPLNVKLNKQETPVRVTVFNNSNQSYDEVKSSTVLRDSQGTAKTVDISPEKPIEAAPYSTTPVDLTIDKGKFEGLSMPLKGFLVASGMQEGKESPLASGTLPITLSEPKVLPGSLGGLSPRA
jgi:hypothetical protein